MREKKVIMIIIGFIILLSVVLIATSSFISSVEYENVTLNGITMEVPQDNITPENVTENYTKYIDTKHNIQIYTYDSEDENNTNNSEIVEFNSILESHKGIEEIKKGNETYNKSKNSNEYVYYSKHENKNIIVITENEDDMLHILENMKITNMSTSNPLNKTDNVTTKTSKSSAKKSNSSSKDDGIYWDDEYNAYFDKNDRSVYEGQFAKGTSKKEMKEAFDEIERETNYY